MLVVGSARTHPVGVMPRVRGEPTIASSRADRKELAVASRTGQSDVGPSGWIVFAATMLFIVGMFDAIWGLAAVLNDQVVTVGGHGGVIVLDFTVWGWIHIVTGLVMVATSVGLFAMKGWARWLGVLFASLSAIFQVGVLPAFPIWALIIIALDVVVIYQLTVRWEPAY
jgi:hypothetical protein